MSDTPYRFDDAPKDPRDTVDYAIQANSLLGAESDTLASVTWAALPAGGASVSSQTTSGTLLTVWTTGGIEGQDAAFTAKIVTAAGRTHYRTIVVPVRSL